MCHIFSRTLEFIEARKTCHRVVRAGLKLINSLLWRALQQKLYHQDFRDFNHLKRILLHCWVRRRNRRGARVTAKKSDDGVYGTQ